MYQSAKNALAVVGDHHRFQKMLVVFLFLVVVGVNYLILGPTFIFMNPLFECNFTDELVN
jgi:hypothetical protein